MEIHKKMNKLFPYTLLLVSMFSFLLIHGCKKDETGIGIKAILYSFETALDDPGFECELYGSVWSLPGSASQSSAHDHFQHSEDSYFEMGNNTTHIFNESALTVKTWNNLEESDIIKIRIKLSEDDIDIVDTDDSFGEKTFEFAIDDLLDEMDLAKGYAERGNLTVFSGTESITVTFRFKRP